MWVQKSHNWTPCLGWSQTSPAKLPCTHLPPHLWNQLSAENTPDSCDLVTQSTLLNQEPVGANSWDAQAALRTLSFPSPNITPPPPNRAFASQEALRQLSGVANKEKSTAVLWNLSAAHITSTKRDEKDQAGWEKQGCFETKHRHKWTHLLKAIGEQSSGVRNKMSPFQITANNKKKSSAMAQKPGKKGNAENRIQRIGSHCKWWWQ